MIYELGRAIAHSFKSIGFWFFSLFCKDAIYDTIYGCRCTESEINPFPSYTKCCYYNCPKIGEKPMSGRRLNVIRMRAENEMKAYADGYRACGEQFKEYLAKHPVDRAIEMMDFIINNIVGLANDINEEEGESK